MRVKDVLRNLKEYDPDDEIIIQWFDKNDVSLNLNKEIPNNQWPTIVEYVGDCFSNGLLVNEINEIAHEIITKENNQ